ncbi:hypothetical protein FACS189450_08790 [Spirochaetia bacterium]|nr:hypothetical protein FACS189450_08790 [Spirochaetia bacterium]
MDSWTNEYYKLETKDAGYYIRDKNREVVAWIGITEKSNDLKFVIVDADTVSGNTGFGYNRSIYKKAKRDFKDSMEVDDDENWIYSRLALDTILREETEEKQREIVKAWINKIVKKIL